MATVAVIRLKKQEIQISLLLLLLINFSVITIELKGPMYVIGGRGFKGKYGMKYLCLELPEDLNLH